MQLRVFSLLCFLMSIFCWVPPIQFGPKHFLTAYFIVLSLYFAFIGWSYMAKYSKSNRYSHLWSGSRKVYAIGLVFVGFLLSGAADKYFMTF
jgi:hypothetical protein